jgi:hypothetical protein
LQCIIKIIKLIPGQIKIRRLVQDKMDLVESDSYDDVKPFWEQLNRTYKNCELTVDWEIHRQVWNLYYKENGYSLNILVGFEKQKCIGLIPFLSKNKTEGKKQICTFGEESIIAREYFSPPNKIHQFIPYFPTHTSSDLSCFYTPACTQYFTKFSGSIIDLKGSEEEYYRSLNKKKRYALVRNARDNSDIEIKVYGTINDEEIMELKEKYTHYWVVKNVLNDNSDEINSEDIIIIDFYLLKRAEEMGKLIALHFYLNKKLVAVNYSVRREKNRVDDYLCIRDTDEKYSHRGLGIYAIIKNMEHCRKLGIRYYDLSDFVSAYKRKFINTDMYYYVLPNGELQSTTNSATSDIRRSREQEVFETVLEGNNR